MFDKNKYIEELLKITTLLSVISEHRNSLIRKNLTSLDKNNRKHWVYVSVLFVIGSGTLFSIVIFGGYFVKDDILEQTFNISLDAADVFYSGIIVCVFVYIQYVWTFTPHLVTVRKTRKIQNLIIENSFFEHSSKTEEIISGIDANIKKLKFTDTIEGFRLNKIPPVRIGISALLNHIRNSIVRKDVLLDMYAQPILKDYNLSLVVVSELLTVELQPMVEKFSLNFEPSRRLKYEKIGERRNRKNKQLYKCYPR